VKMKTINIMALTGLMAGSVSAEVTRFTIGDFVEWISNVVGLNLVNLATAIQPIIFLLFTLAIAYYVWRKRHG
jgi:hypothetical protein